MGLAAELGIDQFRPQTAERVMGWDDAGMPILVGPFQGATAGVAGVWGYVPAPAAGDEEKCLFGDGSWKEVPTSEVKSLAVTISSAEVLDIFTTPKVIVPAPGAGKFIHVVSIAGYLDYQGVVYTTNTALFFKYNNISLSINTASWNIAQTTDKIFRFALTSNGTGETQATLEDQPITLSEIAGNPAAGNSPLKVFIIYQIITL